MEGQQWLRLGVIIAMVLASIYVLMPTVVRIVEGPQVELATKAEAVNKPGKAKAPDLRVRFTAGDIAVAEEAADALDTRLQVAKVPTSRVRATPEGIVEVVLAPGGRREVVEAIAAAPGAMAVYPFEQVFPPVPGAPADAWRQEAPKQAGLPAPPAAVPMSAEVGPITGMDKLLFTTINGEVPDRVVLGVDGVVRAVATRDATDRAKFAVEALVPSEDRDLVDLAVVGAARLPTALAKVQVQVAEEPTDAATGPVEPKYFPKWFIGMLPNTPMNLGLDLQGGIDLTLQVELEEAVMAQVGREASQVRTQAKADGIAIDQVTRDVVDPTLRIRTAMSVDDLRAWMTQKEPNFEYLGIEQGDGGSEYLFRLRDTEVQKIMESSTDQVLETLRNRIDATGVKEPSIVKKGPGQINVQLPGMVNLQQAIDAIGTRAVLEFRLVDEEFEDSKLQQILKAARDGLPADQYADDDILNAWLHETGRLAKTHIVLWEYEATDGAEIRRRAVPLHEDVVLTGNDVNSAGVAWNQQQQPYVSLEFKSRGATTFCTITTDNVGKRFAIILDNEIESTPVIRDRICGGNASIEMGQSMNALTEANTLALVLRTGSLNAPVSIGEVRTVGATLGHDAIWDGTMAAAIGSILVFIYMAAWYRVSGLIANAALACHILMMMAILALFGATLTLPGIAGIALTGGMAVDANIIIYERIREELRLGMNARKAVDVGFEKAFNAIVDSNVTSAIAGIVLYSYGTGPIKGFAVAMNIGIVATLITGLFVSRTFMEFLTRNSATRLSI